MGSTHRLVDGDDRQREDEMDARVSFDVSVGETVPRHARLVANRADTHTLGDVAVRSKDDVERMYRLAGQAIDPGRAQNVMREGDQET